MNVITKEDVEGVKKFAERFKCPMPIRMAEMVNTIPEDIDENWENEFTILFLEWINQDDGPLAAAFSFDGKFTMSQGLKRRY